MVIIVNSNGDVVKNIPENVYQGSNNANSIVVLAPFSSSSQLTIAYRLPNGLLTEPALMTPYSEIPNEYNLNAWYIDIDAPITEYYGNVDFQISATTNANTVVASFGFNFPVLRGVPSILPPTPSQDIYEQILTALASIEADIVNGWLESKGLLPYDETFTYSLNATLYDNNTFYKSKIPDNIGNPLTDTESWEEIPFATEQEVADLIQTHNISGTAHNDIRLILAGLIDGTYPIDSCANVSETINDILISDIFESNGITAKKATSDGDGNNIVDTYQTKANLVRSFSETPVDTKYPSEKLVKDYVDEKTTKVIVYKGLWDTTDQTDYSSLNSYRPISAGWRYECSGTGCTIDTVEYLAGDFITFNVDVDAETTIITSMIDKTDNTDLVASVNGKKGTVVLDGADINATIEISGVESTETISQHLQNLEDNIEENGVIWDGTIAESFAGGTGTEEDPYLISNGAELAYLAYICNNGIDATLSKYYKLIKNIYLNKNPELYKTWGTTPPENVWIPIGIDATDKEFQGIFDGEEHIISGLYIDNISYDQGLFGCVSGGTIKNFGVVDGYIEANQRTGGIVGYLKTDVTGTDSYIENCFNCTIVTCIDHFGTTGKIGGIIGYASATHSVVNNCYNKGFISGTAYIGGIIGQIGGGVKISNCYNKGTIFASASNAGGILGHNSEGKVLNSYNYGFISGDSNIGGIVGGNNRYADINNCYNIGTVTCSVSNCGAIAGKNLANCTVSNSYYIDGTDVVGLNGGTVLNTSSFIFNTQYFTNSVYVGANIYTVLISALNAWVRENQDETTNYLSWEKQAGEVENRFPILTTNDTWEDLAEIKSKLSGIEDGAEVNVIETVKVNNVALTPTEKTVSFTVPTQASDIDALPDTTKYGATVDLTYTALSGELEVTLKDQDGTTLNSKKVDLPLELIITSGTVETCTVIDTPVAGYVVGDKYLDLVLANGGHIYVLVSDLVDQITITETGTGNAVTDIAINGSVITETKGKTFVETSRTVAGKELSSDITLASSDLTDSANLIKGATIYGGTISDNFDTITKNGFYTGYGTATGAPNTTYSWFLLHENSNVGTASATQKAVAYNSSEVIVFVRVKMGSTWGAWVQLEMQSNKVTSISSSSTDTQYASAKCVYDIVGDIETLLGGI